MENHKHSSNKWKVIALIGILFSIMFGVLYFCNLKTADLKISNKIESGETFLSLWTKSSNPKTKLISYIDDMTDNKSENYIPIKDRIAVFDLDGTLFCETDPIYFDWYMYVYRVLEDPKYKNLATKHEVEVANKIKDAIKNGSIPDGLEKEHAEANATAYTGMSPTEFEKYTRDFMNKPAVGYDGMTRGEAFYKPMLQVIDYLKANDFTVFVCSGTDRFEVRTIVDDILNLPMSNIIGSDSNIIAKNQGKADGLDYVFKKNDELILGGEFIVKNVKMNKVSSIVREIGQQPVLSFGNSTGDSSMAQYVINNNKYKSLAFMVCCDDIERENGNIEKANKMYQLCKEFDWVPISMKNDWITIYGDKVSKKHN